ncbi:hypothetical protein [Pseudomonas aeruginosa]|uniref:hypothetical protein n=1 Tax=Pseudomonas aeruginosa TaxID=287 RepID=UPI0012FDA935|nr:hypothetical protein [Pseudomonas aeruginosa]
MIGNGARLRRVDLTTNRTVGRAMNWLHPRLSTQRVATRMATFTKMVGPAIGRPRPLLQGLRQGSGHPQVPVPKCKRNFGEDSPEFRYLLDLAAYCDQQGVVRMEQELKSEYLAVSGWSGGAF